ncbi:MAG: potassium channel family protein [Desulfobacterales bacterium]
MIIRKRLYHLLVLIFLVIMAGSVGYYIIFNGEAEFLDCVYMTVISLTTVGYSETIKVTGNDTAQIFTMLLIIFGMGTILYGVSSLTALFLEGELSGLLRKKRMAKHINKLSDHYIVCGGGQTGSGVIAELCKNNQAAVLIEEDRERNRAGGGDCHHTAVRQGHALRDHDRPDAQ